MMKNENPQQSFLKILGPGLLFAGSAIGVSHLVQSTRAGGLYGFSLFIFVILALSTKYPAFFFAPRYASATGKSLISSYHRQGKLALSFFAITTLCTMFIATSANLLVSAGLVKIVLNLNWDIFAITLSLAAIAIPMLIFGGYHLLDLIIKVLIVIFTLATITATIFSFPLIDWSFSAKLFPHKYDMATILFIAAFVGWMPAPLDVSVWQSQWTVAKIRDTKIRPSLSQARLDFNIGYFSTAILAICFIVMGTAVLHSKDIEIANSPAKFAAQIISLYESALGSWSAYIVGISALGVMFSTLLTILDGFPRALANFTLVLRGKDETSEEDTKINKQRHYFYWLYLLIMVSGGLIIIRFYTPGMNYLIDFAATISFLGAPVYAFLNHRAILGPEVPIESRPNLALKTWSLISIAALSGFALLYIYLTSFY